MAVKIVCDVCGVPVRDVPIRPRLHLTLDMNNRVEMSLDLCRGCAGATKAGGTVVESGYRFSQEFRAGLGLLIEDLREGRKIRRGVI